MYFDNLCIYHWKLFLTSGLLFLLITSCAEKNIYTFSTTQSSTSDTLAVKNIKLYLETSVSMQGYVNSNVAGTYPLKDVVPNMITDIDKAFSLNTELITISDKQKKFPYSKNKFFDQLRSGKLFQGKSSKLQNVFVDIISNNGEGNLSILISDCIPDLGKVNTKTEGTKITNQLYAQLAINEKLAAALFQYKSDFNGTYYYDSNNTGGKVQSKRPFYNIILNNRPFYIWVFGDRALVSNLLSANVIKGYSNAYAYNISYADVNSGLMKNPKSGKISINPIQQTLLIKEIDIKRPVIFTIGINASQFSTLEQGRLLDNSNYSITPEYIEKTVEINVKKKKDLLQEDIKDKVTIQKLNYTHFLSLTLYDLDLSTEKIAIRYYNREPSWIKKVNLIDDVGIDASAIEGKTFGFNFITDAFAKAYPSKKPEVEFILTKKKQQ